MLLTPTSPISSLFNSNCSRITSLNISIASRNISNSKNSNSSLKNNSRYFNIRHFSATPPAPPASSVTLPPNLELADPTIFEAEKVPPVKDPLRYYFPPLNGPAPLPVKSFKEPGKETGELVALDPRVFRVALRKDIIHNTIVQHRARLRQPKKTKRKSEIRGSNKKPHPQKVTKYIFRRT
jgi:hypothetical protein